MTWVYVLVGLLCLFVLQALRTVLAMVFPLRQVRPGTRPEARQFGGLDLIDDTTDALCSLGFEGPTWLRDEECQSDIETVNSLAAYRNVQKNTVAWIGPTIEIGQPEQLLTYYTTLLDDGRFAVTQISDPYYDVVADPKTPAQTIAPSEKAEELRHHLEFVNTLGRPAVANVPVREAVLQFAGEHMNGIRQRLLERGKLREVDGIARPTFAFAIRILRKFATRPVKPGASPRGIPTARLSFFARLLKRANDRAPAQSMQWLLLLISAVLFLVIGWPLFGLNYSVIILAVILFHEGGHWAAMKAFGYRNPHITLLPLLGGVTIGHETDPGAFKRVWVSLAGPLPGIVLGWLMLGLLSSDAHPDIYAEWLLPAIIVLLFINYLNVLPIPPLDGSNVLRALLPPGWIAVQAITVLFGFIIGVYVAYLLEFWPLAFIAALQLYAVKSLWRDARLVRHFERNRPPRSSDEDCRTEWLLEELESMLGTPKKAARRIQLAQSVLNQIDMQPMRVGQRVMASLVYLCLVAVPLGAISFAALDPLSLGRIPELSALHADLEVQEEQWRKQADSMPLSALLDELAYAEERQAPATVEAFRQAEERLGRSLPEYLREFYLINNGFEAIEVGPVDSIAAINPELFVTGDLQYHVYAGSIAFFDDDYAEVMVSVDSIVDWVQIGHAEEWGSYLFIDPAAEPDAPAVFAVSSEDTSTSVDIAALARSHWVAARANEFYVENYARLNDAAENRLRDVPIEGLLNEFPRPGLLERLLFAGEPLADPAGADAIKSAERRIGRELPEDHKRVLRLHNGFGPISLFSVENIESAANAEDYALDDVVNQINLELEDAAALTTQELQQCWAIAGITGGLYGDIGHNSLYGQIFWCPELETERRYVSPNYGGYHPSLTSVVRSSAARAAAFY